MDTRTTRAIDLIMKSPVGQEMLQAEERARQERRQALATDLSALRTQHAEESAAAAAQQEAAAERLRDAQAAAQAAIAAYNVSVGRLLALAHAQSTAESRLVTELRELAPTEITALIAELRDRLRPERDYPHPIEADALRVAISAAESLIETHSSGNALAKQIAAIRADVAVAERAAAAAAAAPGEPRRFGNPGFSLGLARVWR